MCRYFHQLLYCKFLTEHVIERSLKIGQEYIGLFLTCCGVRVGIIVGVYVGYCFQVIFVHFFHYLLLQYGAICSDADEL